MDLDRISIEARLRSPWEALDLGFVMARQWWLPLFLCWFIPSFTLTFILGVFFFDYIWWLPFAIVWWFKPFWDRGPLYIVSRRLFGEQASARDVFRNLWRLYKTEWFSWLTIRRFTITRSFDMPLTVLEKISSEKRAERQMVLHRNHSNAASWLSLAALCMEFFFVAAIFSFMAMMIPEQVELDVWGALFEQESILIWLGYFAFAFTLGLIGPFYTCAGFALYISRRIELEAWDIEIRFRHLSEVYDKKRNSMGAKNLRSVVLFCTFGLLAGVYSSCPEVYAQDELVAEQAELEVGLQNASELAEGAAIKEQMFEILEGDDFHRRETQSGWRLKHKVEGNSDMPEWLKAVLDFFWEILKFLGGLLKILATPLKYIEYVLWALGIGLIAYLVYRFREPIGNFVSSTDPVKPEHQAPEVMFGLDVTKESLPDDIPASVRNLWNKQDYRAAVSLLYRALLTGLIHDYDFAFDDSHTEGECVALVKERANSRLSHYVVKLTACWQNLAYGHLVPQWEDIDSLCDSWLEVFPND